MVAFVVIGLDAAGLLYAYAEVDTVCSGSACAGSESDARSRGGEEDLARLSDETDLDRLGGEFASVVHETMRPEHASLWLRPQDERQQREKVM